MNFDYIKVCPLCKKEDSSDEFSTILIGISKQRCTNSRLKYFEDLHTINCCKECGDSRYYV